MIRPAELDPAAPAVDNPTTCGPRGRPDYSPIASRREVLLSLTPAAIEVQGLGKRYTIGRERSDRTLRDTLSDALAAPSAWLGRRRNGTARPAEVDRDFWALRDVSFRVEPGEVVGIIGRNGAGKSTLLKVLSRITEPTEGRVIVRGRLASLLEVGTGFHPELTGRENVYLNGSILGMSRAEINRKFDEIVAFAETEQFLDTPVKYYSSGMYTRLAFAVAAHLDPEILIVDKVLAVGDAAFQKKCLGKMRDVAGAGRTVLFVSHNMQAMARLCTRCVLMKGGQVEGVGDAGRMIAAYLATGGEASAERRWAHSDAPGGDVVRLIAVRVCDARGVVTGDVDVRHDVRLEMSYDVLGPGHVLVPNLNLANAEGLIVFAAVDVDPAWRGRRRPAGRYTTAATVPGNLLAEGTFSVSVAISTLDPLTIHATETDAVTFQVIDPLEGDSARGNYTLHMPGVVRPLLHWDTTEGGVAADRAGPA